jgi:hypothetical protein
MQPFPSRSLTVGAVSLAVLVLVAAAVLPSYAAERPHTHDEYVAHAAAAAAPQPFPISGLSVGDHPAIPFAFASDPEFGEGDWVLHRPDGTTLALPQLTWSTWAPVGDGAIGMAGTEAGPELQVVAGSGHVRTRMVEHFGLVVSPGHEIVAWLGDRGSPHVIEGGGARHLTMPRVRHGREIAALQGADTCQEQDPEGGGCTVFVNGAHGAWLTTSHGIVDRARPMLEVSDVNQSGRVAGLLSRRTAHRPACWGVVRPDGHRVFRSCGSFLDSFSPDGHRVLAERSQARWQSVRRFAILGHDGRAIRSWTFDPGRHRSLSQLTWEDSHHLLGVLLAHGRWGLVRIGTDGTVAYAGTPVAVVNEFTPYGLPRR